MKIELDRRFKDRVKGRFERYEFEVGILSPSPHRKARSKSAGLKAFHGGPARKTSPFVSQESTAQISRRMRIKHNYLREPFKNKSSDIIKFSKLFFQFISGKTEQRRVINYLQAIVRNPILRGDYGNNSPATSKTKGFDRLMIDTGQFFKSILARAKVKRRV